MTKDKKVIINYSEPIASYTDDGSIPDQQLPAR